MRNKSIWEFPFLALVFLFLLTNGCKKDDIIENTVTDIDGNVYQTIAIGTQIWMAENLRTTKYRNGDSIPIIIDGAEWISKRTGVMCWYNNDKDANNADYGALYNHYVISDTLNLAPLGWHVPSDEEWKILEAYLGINAMQLDQTGWRGTDEGAQLKNDTGWSNSGDGNNRSGFSALPGGERTYGNGSFRYAGSGGTWWSATESNSGHAQCRFLFTDHQNISRFSLDKRFGFSIRCIKD